MSQGRKATGGGQVAIRGYLLQTLIALLDALDEGHEWTSVALEPDVDSEKVDVLWQMPSAKKAVQVKSSQNPLTRANVTRWAEELEAGAADAETLELILIGTPSSKAVASERRTAFTRKSRNTSAKRSIF